MLVSLPSGRLVGHTNFEKYRYIQIRVLLVIQQNVIYEYDVDFFPKSVHDRTPIFWAKQTRTIQPLIPPIYNFKDNVCDNNNIFNYLSYLLGVMST